MSYSRNRTPCKYFQMGKCTKGKNCNFAHVYSNSSGNKSSTLQKTTEEKYLDLTNDRNLDRYTREIELDMDEVRSFLSYPNGSSYGLAAPCPVNVIANRDYSSAESRFDYWKSIKQGTIPQYETEAKARRNDMEKCVTFVKKEAKRAARYVQLSTRNYSINGVLPSKPFVDHPLDLTGQSYNTMGAFGNNTTNQFARPNPFSSTSNTSNPFGQSMSTVNPSSSTSNSTFGQSAFGSGNMTNGLASSSDSILGKPAFGSVPFGSTGSTTSSPFGQLRNNAGKNAQNSNAQTPPFGTNVSQSPAQTNFSSFGSTTSPFGKPAFSNQTSLQPTNNTTTGMASSSAFGQSSNEPAFRTTSGTFGSPSFGQSAFGQPAFGNNSSQPAAAAANSSRPAQSAAFGQSTFGQSAFGQPTFGKPSGTGQSAFGSTTSGQPPFGQPSFGQTSFGQSSFGQSSFGQSPFGNSAPASSGNVSTATTSSMQNTSPFGGVNNTINSQNPSPFGQQTAPNASSAQTPFQSFGSVPAATPFGALASSQQSSNQPHSSQQGLPLFVQGLDDKSETTAMSDLSERTIAIFKDTKFELGNIPEIPPPLELII